MSSINCLLASMDQLHLLMDAHIDGLQTHLDGRVDELYDCSQHIGGHLAFMDRVLGSISTWVHHNLA